MNSIICDLDGTLTIESEECYSKKKCNLGVKNALIEARYKGLKIIIYTARNMRTYSGDIKKIKQNTLPGIVEWLNRNEVPYDEIMIGKPWCGNDGFYVDDRAVRPSEFANMSIEELRKLLCEEKVT